MMKNKRNVLYPPEGQDSLLLAHPDEGIKNVFVASTLGGG